MHELKAGLKADKFATFRRFQKSFITHSFCQWPLYTLQPAKRKYTCAISKKNIKTCESVKRNAELFL